MTRGRWRPVRWAAVASLVVVSLAIAGCSADPNAASPDATGEVSIASLRVPLTGVLKSTYYSQAIDWRTCDTHLQCGSVSVPLDWMHISDQSVHVALIRHRATGKRLGALVVDPGGPGESGIQLVDAGVDNAVDRSVAEHYDVIGIDPRGVGLSTPIRCLTQSQEDAYLYAPTVGTVGSHAWIADQKKRARTFAEACRQNTGPLIAHVDTINAAHDLDVVRAALGEKKLNYLGYSYGTYLGAVYAGLYPKTVGRMVFDGPDNPWEATGGSGIDDSQTVGFENELKVFLRSCLADSSEAVGSGSCAFSGSVSSAVHRLETLLASADRHPIAGADGRVADGATLVTGIDDALYGTSEWPDLNKALAQALSGEATRMLALADEYNDRDDDGSYDNSAAAFTAISCLEDGHAVDLDYDARELAKLKKDAPVLGPYSGYGDLLCSGWTSGPSVFPNPISGAGSGPILMVATTGDPATPYANAKDLAKQLVTSHLVTYHGDGHTAYDLGHACVDRVVDAYLLDGTVPRTDPECRDE
jgi:pimeloyl-ACP methyl ester carboxylesterase